MPNEERRCPKDVISFGRFRLFATVRLLEKDGVPIAWDIPTKVGEVVCIGMIIEKAPLKDRQPDVARIAQ
jgi:hypothetical protein